MRFMSTITSPNPRLGLGAATCAGALLLVAVPSDAQAATLTWKGHTWNVTSGGMAGVATGSPSNVSVDSNGYLHLKITNNAGTWTAAELFTTDKLGFGTYQWQVDGPIDVFDKNVVLGLFPYGPAAGIGADGTNEIDIEYSFWGQTNGTNGDFTIYPASGSTIGETSFKFSLNGGTFSTSRLNWSKDSIQEFLLSDFQPITSTTGLIKSWTYAPSNTSVNIPQQALPLGINLWCFDAPPSDGKGVEVVIRDFEFVPEGAQTGGTGGSGGAPGSGGASSTGGTMSTGGRNATGGVSTTTTGGKNATGGVSTASTGGKNATGGVSTASTGGKNATGGVSTASTGGVLATGGFAGTSGTNTTGIAGIGGNQAAGGALNTGGVMDAAGTPAIGGNNGGGGTASTTGGASTVAGTPGTGGSSGTPNVSSAMTAVTSNAIGSDSPAATGSCSCRVAKRSSPFAGFGLLGLLCAIVLRRRQRANQRSRRL
jgi:hypothetical protein